MSRVEEWCSQVIRQTAVEGRDPAKYARLVHCIGSCRLTARQQANPNHLLRQGWSTFVQTLYNAGDLQAFAHYQPGLQDFRDYFAVAFPRTDVIDTGSECFRQLELLQSVEACRPPPNRLYLAHDAAEASCVLPGENLLWKGRHIAHIELGRPSPALWVGIFVLVVTWTWNLLAPETLLGQLFQFVKTRMPGLPALVLDFAVAFGLGGSWHYSSSSGASLGAQGVF